MGKPLFNTYAIYYTDPHIPDKLESHIVKDNYWVASRCAFPDSVFSSFSVRCVYFRGVDGFVLCHGYLDSFSGYGNYSLVRPVVVLESEDKLIEYTDDGYNWKVDQT